MGLHPHRRTPLTDILLERIRRQGPLTFAAFMEACLYHPEHGYYTHHLPASGASDYFTSADVGPLFGRLLGRQLEELWVRLGHPARFDLVECGAGRGRLAQQILAGIPERAPGLGDCLRIMLVESSPRLRRQAEAALAGHGERIQFSAELPAGGVVGCMLSNELVDALPVHRVVQRPQAQREIYVGMRQGELAELEGGLSSPAVGRYLDTYGAPLQPGQLAEVHLAALAWLERAAAALERGFLLTIDYGCRAPELYGPAHPRGTLLAYRSHRAHEDWLREPGRQDLTAHVNFTALEERGRALGLTPLGYTTQTNFLLALARAGGFADLPGAGASAREQLAGRLELKQLIHPEGMGEAFKVLVQGKAVDGAPLSGLEPL